jgi:hypothetical protein
MHKSVMLPQKGGWAVLDDRNMSGERQREEHQEALETAERGI